jgi:hypothetical protein
MPPLVIPLECGDSSPLSLSLWSAVTCHRFLFFLERLPEGSQAPPMNRRNTALAANAVKHPWAGFSLYVAVRSANERIFAERRATYLPTV